jgi:Tfp pilus assembly protein PilN
MLAKYYYMDQAAGIAIGIQKDGSVHIDACQVIKKNKELHFEKKIIAIKAVDELSSHLDTKVPLGLNLSGKGILYKQLAHTAEINANNFSSVLPNANIDDFYVQQFDSGEQTFVAVIRKTDADKWLDLLVQQGFKVLMLSLGPFPVQHIISQLNVYGEEVIFNGNRISRDESLAWTGYRYDPLLEAPFPLKIDVEPVDQQLIMPYAAAFQIVLSEKLDPIKADIISLEGNFQQVIREKRLKVLGGIVIAVFFVALLINFLALSWLNTDNIRLEAQVSRSARSSTDMQSMNDQLKEKEMLLRDLGWDGGINKSRLIDQLAALLPAEITWNELTLNPLDDPNGRNQKELHFFDRGIRILGSSAQIIPVNEWIARIKTKAWVKAVQLENYTFNNELNTGQFSIIVDY